MITDRLITLVSVCLTAFVPIANLLIQEYVIARREQREQRHKEMVSTIDAYTSATGKILMHKSLESMNEYSSSVGPVFKYATEDERHLIKTLNDRILSKYFDETSDAMFYEICTSLSDKLLVQERKDRKPNKKAIIQKHT